MSTNVVTLTFAGDPSALTKATNTVNKDLDGVSLHNAEAGKSFNDTAGKVSKTSKGVKDSVTGVTDALATMGISFPGEQAIAFAGIAFDLSKGAKDLAEGLGEGLSSALTKVKGLLGLSTAATEAQTAATEEGEVAQEGLNTTMEANPIGLVIAAAAALAFGFYELWEHSETFRNGVKALGSDALKVFHSIASAVGSVGSAIASAFDSGVNGAIDVVNFLINGINTVDAISILGHRIGAPAIPDIPHFANGGSFNGLALVGERGPELIAGAGKVIPNGATSALLGGGGGAVQISFTGVSNDNLINALRQGIRARGGNAQKVLGVNS